MRFLALAIETSKYIGEVLLWGIDLSTKFLIKAHISTNKLIGISIGDCLELQLQNEYKRQEVWIRSFKKMECLEKESLIKILDAKAATPSAIIHPSYVGNIVKIEEVLEINRNELIVKFLGFPKETKYIQLQDSKWNQYIKNGTGIDAAKIKTALNRKYHKYAVIDFPEDKVIGHIRAAALVVI